MKFKKTLNAFMPVLIGASRRFSARVIRAGGGGVSAFCSLRLDLLTKA
jgi:hypothetical protein